MSGEFGDEFRGGFFHRKLEAAAEDAADGRYEITRRWGSVLAAISQIGERLSYAEADDSSEADAIYSSIDVLPKVRQELDVLSTYLEVYRQVMQQALRRAVKDLDDRGR